MPRVLRASHVVRKMRKPPQPLFDTSMLIGFGILVVGLLVVQDFLLAFLVAMIGSVTLLAQRIARSLPASHLFLLALILVPLLLSLFTQIFYVKDWLAEGTSFRMNTIFKFYNQAWVLYAIAAAVALHYFTTERIEAQDGYAETDADTVATEEGVRAVVHGPGLSAARPTLPHEFRVRRLVPAMASGSPPLQVPPSTAIPVPHSDTDSETEEQEGHGTAGSTGGQAGWARSLLGFSGGRRVWLASFTLLALGSLVYTYAGTIARETYRETWLPARSLPFTLDGMAFMKVAYPADYAGIGWLNAHARGAPVLAEADDAYYDWKSRVSMFTGLPTIINGIHESEQRYGDELDPSQLCVSARDQQLCLQRNHARGDDLRTLYNSVHPREVWNIIRKYGVHYIYVGFSERQLYSHAGLQKFHLMAGHGLRVDFQRPGVTIYEVQRA